ncbi:MAG TPA: MgtC/SapB family protein [Bryobacteraceae bacterium]
MPIHPSWPDIVLRLFCTVFAGMVIGLDRGEHGRPAGLRTTILVALAACLAMIQANLLLTTAGKSPDSFVNFDVMRLPLGILSGMGFIGGGAIVRRDNVVLGVTTAATLWFITVVGLCFGGGQIGLGFASLLCGFVVLTALRRLERRIMRDRQGTLKIVASPSGPSEEEIRGLLSAERYKIRSVALVTGPGVLDRELTCQLEWRARETETSVPQIVHELSSRSGIVRVAWEPQAR